MISEWLVHARHNALRAASIACAFMVAFVPRVWADVDTNNTQGIHGSGVRGIHGSGVRGIHGSGTRGIHGSGTRGIHGSGTRGIHSSATTVSDSSTSSSPSWASAALGPVDFVETTSEGVSRIVVLGATFESAEAPVNVQIGDYVLAGSLDGVSLDVLIPIGETYVAGESEVWLVGTVSGTSPDVASVSIGSVPIDYSVLLSSSPETTFESGDLLSVAGVRPENSGPILLGIHGSGNR